MQRDPPVVQDGCQKIIAEIEAGTLGHLSGTLDEVAFALGCHHDNCLTLRETIEQKHHSERGMIVKKRNLDDMKMGGQNGTVSMHETYVPKNITDLAVCVGCIDALVKSTLHHSWR